MNETAMSREEFTDLARNDRVGALLELWDRLEAAELEIATLREAQATPA